jgi:hypothetical protein
MFLHIRLQKYEIFCTFATKTANKYAETDSFIKKISTFLVLHRPRLDPVAHTHLPGDTIR